MNLAQPDQVKVHPACLELPPLTPVEFSALIESLHRDGWDPALPPVVTPDGVLLDGRHRIRAAHQISVTIPEPVIWAGDPYDYVLARHWARRHLSVWDRARIANRLAKLPQGRPKKPVNLNDTPLPLNSPPVDATIETGLGDSNPYPVTPESPSPVTPSAHQSTPVAPRKAPQDSLSQNEAAEMLGVSKRTLQRAKTVIDATTDQRASVADVAREQIEALDANDTTVKNAAQAVASAKAQATRQANKQAAAESERVRLAALPFHPPISLYHCTIGQLADQVHPGSVDAIITDPPYQDSDLDLWNELGEFAVRTLKPGGKLAALSGVIRLQEVLNRITEGARSACSADETLRFEWVDVWLMREGSYSRVRISGRIQTWKPVLVYRNGGSPPSFMRDQFINTQGADDKAGHMWGQSLSGTRQMVERYSPEDGLVVDPFMGSGTTGAACIETGRRFIGGDFDPKAVNTARKRLIAARR